MATTLDEIVSNGIQFYIGKNARAMTNKII